MRRQNLKVLFVLLIPLPYPGAGWTRIEFFANYLKSLSYDVRIAGAFSAKTMNQAGRIEHNKVMIYNIVPIMTLTNFVAQCLNFLSSLIVGLFLYLFLRPSLTIISVPSSGIAVGFYIVAKIFRSKIITDYRDEWEDYMHYLSKRKNERVFVNIIKNIMTRCYNSGNAVMTVTEAVADNLRKRGIEVAMVIPNGADVEIFKPLDRQTCRNKIGIRSNCIALIYTGYVGSYYKLDTLLHSLKIIIDKYNSDTFLIIVGHGTGLKALLDLALEKGIRDHVVALGKIINKQDLVDALGASDIGIIPQDSKPLSGNALPVKSLEYLASGIPVIAVCDKDSLLGKLVVENNLGLIAEPDNIDSLCEIIRRMEEDVPLRAKLARQGIHFVREKYDRNKLAQEFHSLVLECLDCDGGKRANRT